MHTAGLSLSPMRQQPLPSAMQLVALEVMVLHSGACVEALNIPALFGET